MIYAALTVARVGSVAIIPVISVAACPDTATVTEVATRTVLVEEGFEDSALANRGWYDNTGLTLTTAERHSGNSALEVRFEADASLPTFGGASRRLFEETKSLYVSFWIKHSANWVGSGRSHHPHLIQILTNADDRYRGPAATRLTTYIESNYQEGGIPVLATQDRLNINKSGVGEDLTDVTEDRATSGCNGETDGYPTGCWQSGGDWWNQKVWRAGEVYFSPDPGPRYKNDWHFVEVYFEMNSIEGGVGIPDGVARYWYDGELVIDLDDVLFRTGAHPDMRYKQLILGPYIGNGSPVEQTLWLDELTVADSR